VLRVITRTERSLANHAFWLVKGMTESRQENGMNRKENYQQGGTVRKGRKKNRAIRSAKLRQERLAEKGEKTTLEIRIRRNSHKKILRRRQSGLNDVIREIRQEED